jgi:hypothetical protein
MDEARLTGYVSEVTKLFSCGYTGDTVTLEEQRVPWVSQRILLATQPRNDSQVEF